MKNESIDHSIAVAPKLSRLARSELAHAFPSLSKGVDTVSRS